MVSNSLIGKLERFEEPILQSLSLSNYIESDKELELISTILFILTEKKAVKIENFQMEFLMWSEEKASKFTKTDIESGILLLKSKGIIADSLLGFELNEH